MEKLNEGAIEIFALKLFERLGYTVLYGPDIAPDTETPLRSSFESPFLPEILQEAVDRINPSIPPAAREEAVRQVLRQVLHLGMGGPSPDLISTNEVFHALFTQGVSVSYQKDGQTRGDLVWLIDFAKQENNNFHAINQFTVSENNINKRPDIVLFVNGLPLVVIELKNAANEKASVKSAFQQLQTYKASVPSLMACNALLVISDGLEARVGSLTADFSRFSAWKSEDGAHEAPRLKSQLEVLINGLLPRATLLDMLRFFTVFEKTSKQDPATGQTVISTAKKVAAYHQYYAVNKAVASTIAASKREGEKKGKGGVIWHTQGSGKSLSMVFYSGKIVVSLNNPTILVLTDRNDLDDQLFDTFASAASLLRQEPKQADSRQALKDLLKVASGGIVFSTIQKFMPEEGNVYDLLSERRNIVVIADEAHRTQYGFKAKTKDVKSGNTVTGQKIVYGLAKYLRDALPNAVYLGFTGTPIEKTDVNTAAVFGEYIDIYDIAQAVSDGATVPIYYESRLVKVDLPEEGKKLIVELEESLQWEDADETEKAKNRRARLEALIGSKPRIQNVAEDIVSHFEARQKVFSGKGMVVCMSRRIAADLYTAITKLRPNWHNADLSKGKIKVVMTASSDEGPELAMFQTNKQQRRALADRMRDPKDELELVIVCDMWLTGFDVPCLHTMYIDKPLKGHTLMQAIARVNRVYGDKPGGLVVDYLGVAADLKKALAFYGESGGKGDPAKTQEQAVAIMLEKLEVVSAMFDGFAYERYFGADTASKLAVILEAEEFILGLDKGKKRYIDEVGALSAAFALAIPHSQAIAVTDEVAFFQAVKARLVKFETGGSAGQHSDDLETTIKQVIDQALVSDKVIDVFDAAGIKKPDISILSDEFMLEMKNMQHKNIALEVLKKLLNDELTTRSKTNLVQSKALLEMLEGALKRYHNKVITAAEVIDEMIKIGKQVTAADKEAEELNLTPYEYAFYTAVAANNSARELMQKDKLRELAVVLTEQVRKNASIDWSIKESVQAQLRVVIKRTLRKYGYPPDMQQLATDTIMQQAKMIADELAA